MLSPYLLHISLNNKQAKLNVNICKNILLIYLDKFLNNITRYGNFNNVRVLQNFPKWNSFELTPQENDFINNFNQQYYKNKK